MVYLTLHNPFLLSCTWGMPMLPGTQVKTKIHKCFVKTPSQKLLDVKRLLEWFRVTCLINKGYHCLSKSVEHLVVFYLKIYYFPLWFLWISPLWICTAKTREKTTIFSFLLLNGTYNSLHAGVSLRTTSTDHFKTFNKLNRNKWILGKKIKNVLFFRHEPEPSSSDKYVWISIQGTRLVIEY